MLNKIDDDDSIEVSDEEARDIMEAYRHEQIKEAIETLTAAVVENNLSEFALALNKVADEIKDISVNVDFNPQEFVSSINTIRENIVLSNNKVIEALNTRLLPTAFTLVKGYGNITESVNVIYKPANEINKK